MKRLAPLAGMVLAVVAATAAPASAGEPCANAVVQEWLQAGHVEADHPLGCYREALARLDDYTDLAVYSDLSDSIDAALAAAVAKRNGRPVPRSYREQLKMPHPAGASATAAAPVAAADGGLMPVPLVVLAALALGLIAVGTGGAVVRRRRASP